MTYDADKHTFRFVEDGPLYAAEDVLTAARVIKHWTEDRGKEAPASGLTEERVRAIVREEHGSLPHGGPSPRSDIYIRRLAREEFDEAVRAIADRIGLVGK